MITKNNPFSKDASTKRFFDWSLKGQYSSDNENFSLQRYKELFTYFVSCFRNGKIEILKNDLFNKTWETNYNQTIGCRVFHLAVNCYLYYIGYREKTSCVSHEQKKLAQNILKSIKESNTKYYKLLNMQDIKVSHIYYFLQESEIMPKNEIGKVLIIPDICRDFYIFSLLFICLYQPINIKECITKNSDISYFRKFITNAKKEKENLSSFFQIFYIGNKAIQIDTLYSILENSLQPLFTEMTIQDSITKLEQYHAQFSEEVLVNEYKKQISEFVTKSFSALKAQQGTVCTIQNAELINYRFLTHFVGKTMDKMTLDSLQFNIFCFICTFLLKHKLITETDNINIKDTKKFLDYLENENLDFLIGSSDVLQPHDYRNLEQLERYETEFNKLYILGWFRDIIALKSNFISIKLTNININISIPSIKDMQDEYSKENGFFYKKGNIEKFTEKEFVQYVQNTYRNLSVSSDIVITLSDKYVGKYIRC